MLSGHFVDNHFEQLVVLHLVVSSETEKYKVNSVQEALTKCFVVYILQITWKNQTVSCEIKVAQAHVDIMEIIIM